MNRLLGFVLVAPLVFVILSLSSCAVAWLFMSLVICVVVVFLCDPDRRRLRV